MRIGLYALIDCTPYLGSPDDEPVYPPISPVRISVFHIKATVNSHRSNCQSLFIPNLTNHTRESMSSFPVRHNSCKLQQLVSLCRFMDRSVSLVRLFLPKSNHLALIRVDVGMRPMGLCQILCQTRYLSTWGWFNHLTHRGLSVFEQLCFHLQVFCGCVGGGRVAHVYQKSGQSPMSHVRQSHFVFLHNTERTASLSGKQL